MRASKLLRGAVDDFGESEKNIFSLPYHLPRLPRHKPPKSAPLGTYETKMASRTGQRSSLTFLRKNKGL